MCSGKLTSQQLCTWFSKPGVMIHAVELTSDIITSLYIYITILSFIDQFVA